MNIVYHTCAARPCPPPLSDGDVHIWALPLTPPPLPPEALTDDLTPEEQLRAQRYRLGRVREQFIVGRGFLRRLLGGYLSLPPREVPIAYEGSGKPVLRDARVRFNLTHADGLALLAFAGRHVGVDVERVRTVPNADALVERFFSAAEGREYRQLPEALRPASFFRAWTCKEAVIKAAGASIESLQAFDVEMHPEKPPAVRDARHPVIGSFVWRLTAWTPQDGFAAAVAVEDAREPAAPNPAFCVTASPQGTPP